VELATRVLDGIRKIKISSSEGRTGSLVASIGVASCPFHARAPAELIAAAERAMSAARRAGGARVELADA
jgi:GGDEF domain-containing protein